MLGTDPEAHKEILAKEQTIGISSRQEPRSRVRVRRTLKEQLLYAVAHHEGASTGRLARIVGMYDRRSSKPSKYVVDSLRELRNEGLIRNDVVVKDYGAGHNAWYIVE